MQKDEDLLRVLSNIRKTEFSVKQKISELGTRRTDGHLDQWSIIKIRIEMSKQFFFLPCTM